MERYIYLVGQISPKFKITYAWRKYVREYFKLDNDKYILDPCSNGFNRKILEDQYFSTNDKKRFMGIDVLPSKDLTYIKKCDIAIVNMNQYDKEKPLLGTFYEMAWLYMNPEKTVISFADDLNSYECKHPFVKQTVDVWCENIEDVCRVIDTFFTQVEAM